MLVLIDLVDYENIDATLSSKKFWAYRDLQRLFQSPLSRHFPE
jgi:hypothetical protein